MIVPGAAASVSIGGVDLTPYVSKIHLGSPFVGCYGGAGELEAVELDYKAMSPDERVDVLAWIRSHKVDPGRVPAQVRIGYDRITDEWRIPVYVQGPSGRGIRIDVATQEPILRTVRRRRRPLPVGAA